MNISAITEKIIGCSFRVHNQLGCGFLEKVYENALALELRTQEGFSVKQQHPIPVYYSNQKVGEYFADLFVEDTFIVEIKAVNRLLQEHEAQLVHYLTATRIDHGLLINFGTSVAIRHKYRNYKKKK